MNYNEEQTRYIVAWYEQSPTTTTVENLAEELGKSTKSIIGKLSREGVYQRATYKTRLGSYLLQKWNSLTILLRIWELRLRIYLVSKKLRKPH